MLRVAARSAVAARAAARAMSSAAHRPLDGKVVVVCGAGNPPSEGHGIGAWTSIVMARQGATVVSVSNDLLNCETVTGAIEAEGHLNGGMAYTADCTQSADVKGLVDACVDKYGRVDVLVPRVGIRDGVGAEGAAEGEGLAASRGPVSDGVVQAGPRLRELAQVQRRRVDGPRGGQVVAQAHDDAAVGDPGAAGVAIEGVAVTHKHGQQAVVLPEVPRWLELRAWRR